MCAKNRCISSILHVIVYMHANKLVLAEIWFFHNTWIFGCTKNVYVWLVGLMSSSGVTMQNAEYGCASRK